ncbi:MAG: phosphoadenosine phosphosulfate reductase family protein [Oscillospiraceae bacterium]|nr:phosphoadenosine phosphosulfate reductase family protein [Oscillospiraceae bacterium]
MDKESIAFERLRQGAEISKRYYEKPLMICYSGGKDSDVLLELAIRSGIDFEVVHSHTSVDAPETFYYIRQRFKELEERGVRCSVEYPKYKGKRTSMWQLILIKKIPPTRLMRYCCAVLKETSGNNRCIATGVRWDESISRKKREGYMRTPNQRWTQE